MAIDLKSERLIPFGEVPRLPWMPSRRRGRKLHIATVHRWFHHGLHGVRLEAIRVGGTLCTSEEALQRFFDQLTRTSAGSGGAPTPMARQNQLNNVDNELNAAGF